MFQIKRHWALMLLMAASGLLLARCHRAAAEPANSFEPLDEMEAEAEADDEELSAGDGAGHIWKRGHVRHRILMDDELRAVGESLRPVLANSTPLGLEQPSGGAPASNRLSRIHVRPKRPNEAPALGQWATGKAGRKFIKIKNMKCYLDDESPEAGQPAQPVQPVQRQPMATSPNPVEPAPVPPKLKKESFVATAPAEESRVEWAREEPAPEEPAPETRGKQESAAADSSQALAGLRTRPAGDEREEEKEELEELAAPARAEPASAKSGSWADSMGRMSTASDEARNRESSQPKAAEPRPEQALEQLLDRLKPSAATAFQVATASSSSSSTTTKKPYSIGASFDASTDLDRIDSKISAELGYTLPHAAVTGYVRNALGQLVKDGKSLLDGFSKEPSRSRSADAPVSARGALKSIIDLIGMFVKLAGNGSLLNNSKFNAYLTLLKDTIARLVGLTVVK